MSTVTSNLYPPIIPDVTPAFIRTDPCRIYFSLSIYNRAEDIKNVQVSLINQKTNLSALNSTKYPSGIKIADLQFDGNIQGDYKYYIEITPNQDLGLSDLITSEFNLNEFYIAQLRFTSISAPNPPQGGLAVWLNDNIDYFSEWSKTCLIKGIEEPSIELVGLTEDTTSSFDSVFSDLIGKFFYQSGAEEKEYLKNYNITIYEGQKIVYQSGEVYTNKYNSNEINYSIPYNFLPQTSYVLNFTYSTNNLYTDTLFFPFVINSQIENELDVIANLITEENFGRIKIIMDFDFQGVKTANNLIVKRASSKTNFTIWEDLIIIPHNTSSLGHIWYDNSIESGIWYKYRIQQKKPEGNGKVFNFEEPVMCVFEDMFLTDGNRQLKIQFNPSISEFKYNTIESQQVALGSKFPYIKRNGNSFFRTFSISGLISSFIDRDDWYNPNLQYKKNLKESFTSKTEIYGDSLNLYNEYNENHDINDYQDYIYEREFRQKVFDFLYQNNLKLFRSLTEGNIIIKLINISFQPMEGLSRRLYSFSASAVEIDDLTAKNYVKYNLLNKNCYLQQKDSISNSFGSEESIINKIVLTKRYNKNEFNPSKLKINLNQNIETTCYVKTVNNPTPLKYVITNRQLEINFDDTFIEDCYFSGNNSNLQATIEYYYETREEGLYAS